jgi:hypothetical protein
MMLLPRDNVQQIKPQQEASDWATVSVWAWRVFPWRLEHLLYTLCITDYGSV